ncbi:MAG: dimethyl sulfoxide reductase anchor subunit [Verrucomicrobia bacterium]|nr:dimethyl sulfoxide reductase anchor subunit [Verrucomicrobiota bacterium]
MSAPAQDNHRTLIDELLAEQRNLTAVERFSQKHEREATPAQARFYRDLIPLTLPKVGQQYAFEVDLDKCTGCKACVSACHSMNGLDDGETWRDVGLLFSDNWRAPQQQNITTACHHCVEPGCLEGCPVLAYDKDPVTGIVRHLDDQCIGCQYCVMKCPYDVPKYSARRGIVRKCDMCSERLAVGEAPACAQACPNEAIRIAIVETSVVRGAFSEKPGDAARFLPATPDPGYTLPTTRYKSARPLPADLLAGDHARLTPADAHPPLVFLLVLSQLAVGASVAAAFAPQPKGLALIAAFAGALSLGVASLHLGKPLKAWRAFLGWRRSWFSREVIVLGAFVSLAALAAATPWFAPLARLQRPLTIAAAAAGLLGVACSAMIYADTRRAFWSASQCFGRFFGTTLALGTAATLATMGPFSPWLAALLLIASLGKLALENRIFLHLVDQDSLTLTTLNKSARLLTDALGLAARVRVAFGVFGGAVLPAFFLAGHAGSAAWVAPLALCLLGDLLERYLFFAAVAPVNMPGGVAS